MRKIVAAFLILALCLSFCACGGKGGSGGKGRKKGIGPGQTELVLANQNSVEDYADFSLFKVVTGKKITASISDDIHYENDTEGETYVDIVLDWTNTSTETISSEDLLVAYATNAKGKDYTECLYAIETRDGTYLRRHEDIEPLFTVRLHCAITVPESETDLTLYLDIKGEQYVCSYTLGDRLSCAKEIQAGETIEAVDHATLVFHGMEYTDDVSPSNTSGMYTHYVVDDTANTYLLLRFDITNYMSSARDCDTFVGVKAVYMDKYTYTGFAVVEDGDGRGFSAYDDIDPLSTRHLYYLIEVPKVVTENEVELTISFNGQEYIYTGN